MNESQSGDVELFNLTPTDAKLHANVLVIHVDNEESPSCTAVHIGHFLRHDGNSAIAFETGNYVTTSPFRIETSRLGKRFDQVTHDDINSLRKKYEFEAATQFTVVLRRNVLPDDEVLRESDIVNYTTAYHNHRDADIEAAWAEAAEAFTRYGFNPDGPVTLFFSPDDVPTQVASTVLSESCVDGNANKAYALFWHLCRRASCRSSLGFDGDGDGSPVVLQLHPQVDGTCCIGVYKRNPLLLVGSPTELVHFHHVAATREAAEAIAQLASKLITAEFKLPVEIETASSMERSAETCELNVITPPKPQ